MIPRDCSPVIPDFYMEHLRALARSTAAARRLKREAREDMEQEAVAQFLTSITPHELANPSAAVWARVRKLILPALTAIAHDEERGHESIEDYPGLLERQEEPAEEFPTWIPREPAQRRSIIEKCRELLRADAEPVRDGSRSRYAIHLSMSIGGRRGHASIAQAGKSARVVISGDFKTRAEAQAARRDALRRIIEWCSPVFPPTRSRHPSRIFRDIHAGPGAKPAIYYGDPLACLIYLESFAAHVGPGHRYDVGDLPELTAA